MAKPAARLTREQIRAALARIDPDLSQHDWFRVAAGLYNELGDGGFSLFDEWSSESETKYPGSKGCWQQWVYSRRYGEPNKRERPITIGTVLWLAKDSVYVPRTKVAPPPQRSGACARCGKIGLIERHHWAPAAVFADFDAWPTADLCRPCHALWHEQMSGYVFDRRAMPPSS